MKDSNRVKIYKNATRFIDALESFFDSLDYENIVKLISEWEAYIKNERNNIINVDDYIKKEKELFLNSGKENAIKYIDVTSTPITLDKNLVIHLANLVKEETNLYENIIKRIDNDPRFFSLKEVDKKELLKYIENTIFVDKIDENIKNVATSKFNEDCIKNEDYIFISQIKIVIRLYINILYNKKKNDEDLIGDFTTISDKSLINEFINESKHLNVENINKLLQEISNRIASTRKVRKVLTELKEIDYGTMGAYYQDLDYINVSSLLLYRLDYDKNYSPIIPAIVSLKVLEHESAHSANHQFKFKVLKEIYDNKIDKYTVADKIKNDRKVYIALSTLIENMFGYIVEDEKYYSSLIDEQNSRNEESRFLENVISSFDNKEITNQIKALYIIERNREEKSIKKPHLKEMIETINKIIYSDGKLAYDLYKPLETIIDAFMINIEKYKDDVFEESFNNKYFTHLYSDELSKLYESSIDKDCLNHYLQTTNDNLIKAERETLKKKK